MDELAASRRRVSMGVLLVSSLVVLLAVGLTTATMPHAEHLRTEAAAASPRPTHPTATSAPTTVAPTTTAAPITTSTVAASTPDEALTAASVATPRTTVAPTTTVLHRVVAATPTTVRPPTTTVAPPTTVAVPPSAAATLACIRQRESGGNYAAVSASGTYRGAYQFSQATWNSAASHAGRPDLVGVPPNLVAPADQDAVALSMLEWQGLAPWGGSCG